MFIGICQLIVNVAGPQMRVLLHDFFDTHAKALAGQNRRDPYPCAADNWLAAAPGGVSFNVTVIEFLRSSVPTHSDKPSVFYFFSPPASLPSAQLDSGIAYFTLKRIRRSIIAHGGTAG